MYLCTLCAPCFFLWVTTIVQPCTMYVCKLTLFLSNGNTTLFSFDAEKRLLFIWLFMVPRAVCAVRGISVGALRER